MKIAMTGGTGRVGSRLLPRLLDRYGDVRVLVRSEASANAVAKQGATPVLGALDDPAALADLVDGADVLVHAAAALRTDIPGEHERVNVGGTRALGAAAAKARIGRVVHMSTNLVYPGGLGRPATEDDPVAPDPQWGAYAASKAQAEQELRDCGLDLIILRLAFVYGEDDPHLRESLRWAGGWPSYQRLQLVHHADVAQAVHLAIGGHATGDPARASTPRSSRTASRTYNVADLAPVSAVELHQLTSTPLPAEWSTVEADLWHGIVSTNRIRAELGFHPRYPSAWTAADDSAL